MSAYTLLVSHITPGQEGTARAVLRDYALFLENLGGQVVTYRTTYEGPNSGRVITYLGAPTTAERAAILDRGRAAEASPYATAIAATNPPLTGVARVFTQSIDPGWPLLPHSPIRVVRQLQAVPGRRRDLEGALRDARARHIELGVEAAGFAVDFAGTGPGIYAYIIAADSLTALDEFWRKNAEAPGAQPIREALDGGIATQWGSRIDFRFDLGA